MQQKSDKNMPLLKNKKRFTYIFIFSLSIICLLRQFYFKHKFWIIYQLKNRIYNAPFSEMFLEKYHKRILGAKDLSGFYDSSGIEDYDFDESNVKVTSEVNQDNFTVTVVIEFKTGYKKPAIIYAILSNDKIKFYSDCQVTHKSNTIYFCKFYAPFPGIFDLVIQDD